MILPGRPLDRRCLVRVFPISNIHITFTLTPPIPYLYPFPYSTKRCSTWADFVLLSMLKAKLASAPIILSRTLPL